jgi:hypothetical protein
VHVIALRFSSARRVVDLSTKHVYSDHVRAELRQRHAGKGAAMKAQFSMIRSLARSW